MLAKVLLAHVSAQLTQATATLMAAGHPAKEAEGLVVTEFINWYATVKDILEKSEWPDLDASADPLLSLVTQALSLLATPPANRPTPAGPVASVAAAVAPVVGSVIKAVGG
jgi:hypothetical protein